MSTDDCRSHFTDDGVTRIVCHGDDASAAERAAQAWVRAHPSWTTWCGEVENREPDGLHWVVLLARPPEAVSRRDKPNKPDGVRDE